MCDICDAGLGHVAALNRKGRRGPAPLFSCFQLSRIQFHIRLKKFCRSHRRRAVAAASLKAFSDASVGMWIVYRGANIAKRYPGKAKELRNSSNVPGAHY